MIDIGKETIKLLTRDKLFYNAISLASDNKLLIKRLKNISNFFEFTGDDDTGYIAVYKIEDFKKCTYMGVSMEDNIKNFDSIFSGVEYFLINIVADHISQDIHYYTYENGSFVELSGMRLEIIKNIGLCEEDVFIEDNLERPVFGLDYREFLKMLLNNKRKMDKLLPFNEFVNNR